MNTTTTTLQYRVTTSHVTRLFDDLDKAWKYLQTLPNGAHISVGDFAVVHGETVWVKA